MHHEWKEMFCLICIILLNMFINYRLFMNQCYIGSVNKGMIFIKKNRTFANEIHTNEYCKNIPFDSRHFLINREKKIVFCWLHKVGSTSIISQFSRWKKRYHRYPAELHSHLRGLTAQNADEALDSNIGLRYILVRHPFSRLVSAYRDRILASYNGRYTYQAKTWGPAILGDHWPILKIKALRANGTLKRQPSFRKFIRWIIRDDGQCLDPHWGRYWEYCRPDLTPFNKYIRLEDISQSGRNSWKIACDYFQEVSRRDAVSLYQIYKRDFEFFNYTPDFFYNCTL